MHAMLLFSTMAVKSKITLLMLSENNFHHSILLFTVVQLYKCIEFMDIQFIWRWICPHFFPGTTFLQIHIYRHITEHIWNCPVYLTHFSPIWHNGVKFMWLSTSVLICRQWTCCWIIFIIKSNLCVNHFYYPK